MLIPGVMILILRTAPMQHLLAQKAAAYLTKELGVPVTVGGFTVNWFLKPVLTDLKILDTHNKTLFAAKKIKLGIKKLDNKKKTLIFDNIVLNQVDANIIYYKADSNLNLQFLLDYFSSTDTIPSTSKPWSISFTNVRILNSHFAYRDERYMRPTKGIDYADMDISGINTQIRNIGFAGDSIFANVDHLSCKEKCGLRLKDFSAQAIVSPDGINARELQIETANSRISMDLKFYYPDWNAFLDFINNVNISASIQPSQLDMRDLVYFSPEIDGMKEVFNFSGEVKGFVSSFAVKNFHLDYGSNTSFDGYIKMTGLPDWEETFVHAKIDNFISNSADISSFTLPYTGETNTFKLPDEIARLGNIAIKGKFTGFYSDFVSNATFTTDAGSFSTNVTLSNNKIANRMEYDGRIQANDFNIGYILDIKKLGTLSLDAQVKGKDFSIQKTDLTVKGEITNLQYDGNTFGLINVDGVFKKQVFTGGVYVNDELAALDFNGSVDFTDTIPAFDFEADIQHANLSQLKLLDKASASLLDTKVNFKFKGNTLDNLLGALSFSDTRFKYFGKELLMKNLYVETKAKADGGKKLNLQSDFLNATFDGTYTFDDMSEYLTLVFKEFLPSLSTKTLLPERTKKGSFNYTIQLLNTKPLTEMFVPWVSVHKETVLSGSFDPVNSLITINGRSPLLRIQGFSMRDWSLKGETNNDVLHVLMECENIDMSEKMRRDTSEFALEQFKIKAEAAHDSVNFRVVWDDFEKEDHAKGDIKGAISFSSYPQLNMHLSQSDLTINDSLWQILPDNRISIDTGFMELYHVGFTHKAQHIYANGILSSDPLNQLVLDFKDFNISNTDLLTSQQGFDMDGYLTGTALISDVYSAPRVAADLIVKGFGFNDEFLGDAEIKSTWDNATRSISVDTKVVYHGNVSNHYPIMVAGKIYPEKEHENFDLAIDVDNLKVRTMEPFFEGLFSRIRGLASGSATLTGDFSDPLIKGKVKLMRSELLVDYLRTSYSFAGDLNFDKHRMWFKDLAITDSTGNSGMVSGEIKHKAFADWNLDITLAADNLAALNTPYNPVEMFYGKARVSGTMSLKGPIDNLVMKTRVTSEKGTSVFIPITFSRSISQNEFIQYKKKKVLEDEFEEPYNSTSVVNLQLGLDVTPDAEIGIILPYQMGNIQVRGEGLINMGIDTRGDYTMHGQYIMDRGNFLFNFENIFKRNFEIQKGGHITFNGSPYDADISLSAVYKIKTSLSGLPNVGENSGTRIPVDCIISLSNNLYNPTIKFGIALPDVSDDMRRIVYSNIDTSNAIEMNQQMISLLVLGSFSSTGGIALNGSGLGISSYELITNQLSSWLSQISKDFDIGVKYRPGDQLSSQELELALSTQLFDNRVTIDGSFGNSYNATSQSSRWIGDVQIEIKITEDGRFRVKAFNRTNSTLDVITGQAPYTQGVGVVYRKEFDNFRDLFKRKQTP